jgi:insulysin
MPARVERPDADHRDYLPLRLDNGLRVTLVSDPECERAAAALSVRAGSLLDPEDLPGLAHLCEHMVFLGTERYPDEDFCDFLARRGGDANAYTGETIANFFLGVSPEHLESALGRFCQLFVAPLFRETSLSREVLAVDSEHAKNRRSDAWRLRQLLKGDANPRHPFSRFSVGCAETLRDAPAREGVSVRQRLLDFHGRYYSANLMCAVLLGRQSVADLELLARETFGAIPDKGTPPPEVLEPTFALAGWPRLVRVLPVEDARAAVFHFSLPQQSPARWRTKPQRYACRLLGREGAGSLHACLRARGLATELLAGIALDEAGACVLEVTVRLTTRGAERLPRVGECLFAYVRLLQQSPVSKELFEEARALDALRFRFRSLAGPVTTARVLARDMQEGLPDEKLLSGHSRAWDFDKGHIEEVFSMLTCARLRLTLALRAFGDDECPETERWYGTRYGAGPLPEAWHQRWEAARTGVAAADFAFALPGRNPFVPEDLVVRQASAAPVFPRVVRPSVAEALPPGVLQVHVRRDDVFRVPRTCLGVEFYCPWCAESLSNQTASAAWARSVVERLSDDLHDAGAAGLSLELRAGPHGLTVRAAGYRDKLPLLLRRTTEAMAALDEVPELTWWVVRTAMERELTNAAEAHRPQRQALEWQRRVLRQNHATAAERLERLVALEREDLRGVSRRLLERCRAEVLLQGDVAEGAEVEEVVAALLPALRDARAPEALPALGVAALPEGSRTLLRLRGADSAAREGAVLVTLQVAEATSVEAATLCELVEAILAQRCFDELRTRQQLGYLVALAAYADDVGFCGLTITVQSARPPAEVHRRIDAWLEGALRDLAEEDEELRGYVEALRARKRSRPSGLEEEFERNWREVSGRAFRFERREEAAAFLGREDALGVLRDFVRERLQTAPRLAVEISASESDEAKSDEAVPYAGASVVLESLEDVEAFRARLRFVPPVRASGSCLRDVRRS